ncbi:MAG: succinyldiaminopimelate transaminase [Pigmentiphaga sp.]
MNSHLEALQPYPFERLRDLYAGVTPPAQLKPISWSIGEPKHPTPPLITEAIQANLHGLAIYPATQGPAFLREAIAQWLSHRYHLDNINPGTQILPVLGSREALFAFTQTVVDPVKQQRVLCPNPFYQIYEGAALMAGAQPTFINADPANQLGPDWRTVPDAVWRETALVIVCSPGNPTGNVMRLEEWAFLFEQSDRHGFVIASDECYSEIYPMDAAAPLGGLEAAQRLGRTDYRNLIMFSSLSKRSNAPGLRSGFVAGDAAWIKRFLLYRTYHGCAMSLTIAAASAAAWQDEQHVLENRRLYQEKFDAVLPILQPVLDVQRPPASFYLWPITPYSDAAFAKALYAEENLTVLPGSFLARPTAQGNPGANRLRLALVAPLAECVEAAERLAHFTLRHLEGD